MKSLENKIHTSIRIEKKMKDIIVKDFGSVQKFLDYYLKFYSDAKRIVIKKVIK